MTANGAQWWQTAQRDVRVRCGGWTGCGGVAGALVDFEPHTRYEFVHRLDKPLQDGYDREMFDGYAPEFDRGVRRELRNLSAGELPPVRVVLRWLMLHPVDSTDRRNIEAGQLAVLAAIRRTNPVLPGALDPDPMAAIGWLPPRRAADDWLAPQVVGELLPAGYPCYLRVLHRWNDYYREDRLATWRELAAQAGAVYHPQLQSRVILRQLRPPQTDEVWSIQGGDGEPDALTRSRLVELLAEPAGQPVWLSFAGPRWTQPPPIVIQARLRDIEAARVALRLEDPRQTGPHHWWPADRGWVVAGDPDLCSSYLACGPELAGRLAADPVLETMPVSLDTRVDIDADDINAELAAEPRRAPR